MLYENATCATGQCCDLNVYYNFQFVFIFMYIYILIILIYQTCRLKPASLECRSALHECDLPEFCTGESEYCPDNVFKIDGTTCEQNRVYLPFNI